MQATHSVVCVPATDCAACCLHDLDDSYLPQNETSADSCQASAALAVLCDSETAVEDSEIAVEFWTLLYDQ